MDIDLLELNNQDISVKPSPTKTLDSFNTKEDQSSRDTPEMSEETALGFHIGELRFLLASNLFCEIVDQNKVSPLPNVPPWFSGVLNLRGDIVPVIDLHILLQDEKSNAKNRHLLAIDKGKKTVAFWIDGYPHLLNTLFTRVSTPPTIPSILEPAITDYQLQDEHVWLTISLDKLFKVLNVHTVQAKG